MSAPRAVRIAVTCGDPSGVGPEVAAKALGALLPGAGAEFLLIGPAGVWDGALARWAPKVRARRDRSPGDPGLGATDTTLLVPEGTPEGEEDPASWRAHGGEAALAALEAGIVLAKAGVADALCTAPLSKERLPPRADGGRWRGHTEILAERCGVDPLMSFWTGALLVSVATDHVPLRDVPRLVTPDRVARALSTMAAALRAISGSGSRRLAVCGINPHAGEGGLIGDEEKTHVVPGIERAREAGLSVDGPFAADALFSRARGRYDGILAMHHDQGLVGAKLLGGASTVHLTLGLPFPRTSPDHGTALDIAGRGVADPSSMRAALETAARLAGHPRAETNGNRSR